MSRYPCNHFIVVAVRCDQAGSLNDDTAEIFKSWLSKGGRIPWGAFSGDGVHCVLCLLSWCLISLRGCENRKACTGSASAKTQKPSSALWHARGSLELGDILSDVSAAPMEMTLLGVQGKVWCQYTRPRPAYYPSLCEICHAMAN